MQSRATGDEWSLGLLDIRRKPPEYLDAIDDLGRPLKSIARLGLEDSLVGYGKRDGRPPSAGLSRIMRSSCPRLSASGKAV